jgi:beta-1,2-mannosidase
MKHSRTVKKSRRAYIGLAALSVGVIMAAVIAAVGHIRAEAARTARTVDASKVVASRQAALPSWAIGPFQRYQHNPILTPPVVPTTQTSWEWPEVFNPGVVVVDGIFHMLYRGTNFANGSSIGATTSTDGYHFKRPSNPVITPSLPSDNQGVEDPRLYYRAGKYYAFFTGDSGATVGAHIDINEAVSTNARTWTQLGPVLDNTKDAAVVADPEGRPVRIGGHYLMYYGQFGQTFLAESTDFVHWTKVGSVNAGLPASDGGYEYCVAVTNYRTTAKGGTHSDIDLFVAGELMGHGRWYYAISEVKFNRSRLRAAAARLSSPALYPQAPYELYGHTPNTVFTNDLIFYHGRWWMYYGAGDSVVALATAKLRP